MSDKFEQAFHFLLDNEGEFTIDTGGPTKYGVTLTTLRNAKILTDREYPFGDFDHDGDIDIDDIRNMTLGDARILYRSQWWDRYNYDAIEDPALAAKVFDFSVNMGPSAAHKLAQRAVNELFGIVLKEDGILGPTTLRRINATPDNQMLSEIRAQAWRYYKRLLAINPDLELYRNGWRNRAYR